MSGSRPELADVFRRGLPSTAPAVVGTVACLVSAATHRHLAPGAYGFLVHVGPKAWYFGLALVVVAVPLPGARRSTARPSPSCS